MSFNRTKREQNRSKEAELTYCKQLKNYSKKEQLCVSILMTWQKFLKVTLYDLKITLEGLRPFSLNDLCNV